jgi:hypothetical protein
LDLTLLLSELAKSRWVDREIDQDLEKEREQSMHNTKRRGLLIPLNLDGYLFDAEWKSDKAGEVRTRLACNFVGWTRA